MSEFPTEETFFETDAAKLKRWLPWLNLFRAFRMAIGIRPLLLGSLALLLLVAGGRLISQLPFAAYWSQGVEHDRPGTLLDHSFHEFAVNWEQVVSAPVGTLVDTLRHGQYVVSPMWTYLSAARHLFRPGLNGVGAATSALLLLWSLAVWSVCGVGISRLAAAEFVESRSSGLVPSLWFGVTRMSASVGALLLPLIGVAVLWIICLIGGGLGRIPAVGLPLVGVLWWLAILCGLGMAIILLMLAVGWPLMLCAVAVEDTEGFDAFSRVYSYVTERPWYALGLALFATVYGSVLLAVVATLSVAAFSLSEAAVGVSLGGERVRQLSQAALERGPSFAASAVQFWRNAWQLLIAGFVVSYFWTAATIIYFLLRKSVDATPLDQSVDTATKFRPDESLPLVGMAAAQQREALSESSAASAD